MPRAGLAGQNATKLVEILVRQANRRPPDDRRPGADWHLSGRHWTPAGTFRRSRTAFVIARVPTTSTPSRSPSGGTRSAVR